MRVKASPKKRRAADANPDPVAQVISALEREGFSPKPAGKDKWEAKCPAHQGDRRNLSVARGDDGRALLHCNAHDCPAEEIVQALGLTLANLFPAQDQPCTSAGPRNNKDTSRPTAEACIEALTRHLGQPTGRWDYLDADSNLVAVVTRFDPPGQKKQYRPIHRDQAGRWRISDPPGLWPLYRLPSLDGAARIYLPEGEECANLAAGLGLAATTTAHGSKSPHKTDLTPLAGREVVLLPDHDQAGEDYAQTLLELLADLDPRPTVKVVRLPLACAGDDIAEWLAEVVPDNWGPEECRAELERLADAAPVEDLDAAVDVGGSAAADDADDDSHPVDPQPWPEPIGEAAYHGLVGEIVRTIEPETEADPGAVLLQLLVMAGSVIGRSPHYIIGSTRHYINENVVLAGETAMGRKGTSADCGREVLRAVDPEWVDKRIMAGLSSGEGVIYAVRDLIRQKKPIREKRRVVGYQDVITDAGVDDKRLLILETEFGNVLRVLEREGNNLSAMLRQAWDHGTLATLTRSPLRATGAHISIIGHITADELIALLSEIDQANGLANRFLWLCVRRSKLLPHGGRALDLKSLTARLAEAITFARGVGPVAMTSSARTLWEDHYERLTTPPPGALGLVTSRAAPHVIRLGMQYALLDRTAQISADHLQAALAIWYAAARSAAHIWGEGTGNRNADRILAALREAPGGLTRSEIRLKVFQNSIPAARVKAALALLLAVGRIREVKDTNTGGAPAHRYFAVIHP
jgi:hypothetical protein